MGRTPSRVHIAFAFLFATLPAGCGGGGATFVQPPPPVADFTIQFSEPIVSVSQGASSSAVNIAITPENGFSGSVAVTLSDLPAGISTNPASPFTITAGAPVTVVFTATTSAAGGAAQISAQGTSGSLSHGAMCTLDCASPVLTSSFTQRICSQAIQSPRWITLLGNFITAISFTTPRTSRFL